MPIRSLASDIWYSQGQGRIIEGRLHVQFPLQKGKVNAYGISFDIYLPQEMLEQLSMYPTNVPSLAETDKYYFPLQ